MSGARSFKNLPVPASSAPLVSSPMSVILFLERMRAPALPSPGRDLAFVPLLQLSIQALGRWHLTSQEEGTLEQRSH